MNNIAFILTLIFLNSFYDRAIAQNNDNPELSRIYSADQSDRRAENVDWRKVSKKDSLRKIRVYELLDSNQVRTAVDYYHAALIFQHGGDSTSYGMAVKMMKKSVELDSAANKWLLAAAIDRYLLSTGKPQIYGTQYMKIPGHPWMMREIDTTKITDEERQAYNVGTLAEQRAKLKRMNSKKLSDLWAEGKSVEELIKFIESGELSNSEFDVSENGIISFGYDVLNSGNTEDALKIFELSIKLYPDAFNAFDSYGECLLKLGRKKDAIYAYRKSLELNPNNTNANQVLEDLE